MRRRIWLGGAGLAGVTGAATLAYRTAPSFWRQFAEEWGRPILNPNHRPRPSEWPDKGLHGAWLGHSSVLLKIDGTTILTDPVLSDRVGLSFGPVTIGLKRLVAPAVSMHDIPKVDLIVLSHAHMDHLDLPTLRSLESRATSVVMASQTSDLIRVRRYREVRELRWNESARFGPVAVKALEVNHWGARVRTDTYRGYNGYLIEAGRHRILFGGDTAATSAFRSVHSSKPVDLAIMPIGAYNPWIRYHCTPEQAWQMGNEAGADRFLPVHHQTFALSREPFREPIERFCDVAGSRQERVVLRDVGQEFQI
jgi:L-ascorbate metabolism protein UlaG (beta-lactamase superfamily)